MCVNTNFFILFWLRIQKVLLVVHEFFQLKSVMMIEKQNLKNWVITVHI